MLITEKLFKLRFNASWVISRSKKKKSCHWPFTNTEQIDLSVFLPSSLDPHPNWRDLSVAHAARKTCILSCAESIFLSKTNSHMVCGHRLIFILQFCCFYPVGRDSAWSLVVGWCSGNFYTDVFALSLLSYAVSDRVQGLFWSNDGENMINKACL